MPKEYIYDMDHGRKAVLDDGQGSAASVIINETALKVGWSKEQEHVGLCVVDMATDIDGMTETVRYINFDRTGLNRTIRALRQARDDAFGKDA